MTYCVHLCSLAPIVLLLVHSLSLFSGFALPYAYLICLPIYGSRRERIACGCMCRLDVTLAQSSSIAPDSSPRRVHLDAAVRGRLLRRAHLESLQHPASTSRGKYTFRVHAPLRSSIRFSAPLVPLRLVLLSPIYFRFTLFFPRSLFSLDRTSSNRRVASVVESDALWRTCGSAGPRVFSNFRVS